MSTFISYWQKKLAFLDVHYHANPDRYERRYHVIDTGKRYQQQVGGCVLKNHLGSTAALASVAQALGLPVFGSVTLNDICGGIDRKIVQQALCQYSFPQSGRLLVHLPTIVRTTHKSKMNRNAANDQVKAVQFMPLNICDAQQQLHAEVKDLLYFAQERPVVISTGHANKEEIYRLIEYIDQHAIKCRLMLNQPANPITGMSAQELIALGRQDWLYVEQTALTLLLGYQTIEDFAAVMTQVPNLLYSSDLGQQQQMDIVQWRAQTEQWFTELSIPAARQKEIGLENPLRMLSP